MTRKKRIRKFSSIAFSSVAAVAIGFASYYLFVPKSEDVDPQITAIVETPQMRGSQAPDIMRDNQPLPQFSVTDEAALADLKLAMDAISDGDIDQALALKKSFGPNALNSKIIDWFLAVSGKGSVSAGLIRDAQKNLENWPSQTTIAKNLERAIARDPLSLVQLRLSLGDDDPLTFQAAFALARTYLATGNTKRVRALLVPYWHDKTLSAADEKQVIATFSDALTKRDHETRFFNMMARDRIRSAARIAPPIDAEKLHAAWSAVIRRQNNASSLIDGLSPADKKTAAYMRMRTEFLRRQNQDNAAIALLTELADAPEFEINPDAWWDERRIISRHKFEQGDAQAAFDVVAKFEANDLKTAVDAAFHAGWYALRGLKKPDMAAPYFEKITQIAKGNISRARGYYWLARAQTDAAKASLIYAKAAALSSTYYGQLAAEKLGMKTAAMGMPLALNDGADQAVSEPLTAIGRLQKLGFSSQARTLYLALGWSLESPSHIRQVADHASGAGDYYAALKIAKAADWRGVDVAALTHPLGAISDGTGLSTDAHALAYAVARQESEFNIGAVSKANARGLLQVLPGTAKEMARVTKLDYMPEKLTTDANYNARLGSAYLRQQLDKFNGSYILTFAAYNAGPRRAKEWIERFGDPRGKPLEDVIDWVEQIPFPETRSYVQRIIENLQVYKAQLGEQSSIVDDVRFGNTTAN